MTAPPPRRPWWTRKRTWAAAAAWLALPVLYVVASGPAYYCCLREWLPMAVHERGFEPARRIARELGLGREHWDYGAWFYDRAVRQGGMVAVLDRDTRGVRFVRQDGNAEARQAREDWERVYGDASD